MRRRKPEFKLLELISEDLAKVHVFNDYRAAKLAYQEVEARAEASAGGAGMLFDFEGLELFGCRGLEPFGGHHWDVMPPGTYRQEFVPIPGKPGQEEQRFIPLSFAPPPSGYFTLICRDPYSPALDAQPGLEVFEDEFGNLIVVDDSGDPGAGGVPPGAQQPDQDAASGPRARLN